MYLLNLIKRKPQLLRQKNLHSTMYLLNRKTTSDANVDIFIFTFHYVSIKSVLSHWLSLSLQPFTFHYVSIKSVQCQTMYCQDQPHLHSTMYLLNPDRLDTIFLFFRTYLHSTMYLLNRVVAAVINSKYINLHSTMYLLNPNKLMTMICLCKNLHSTMYLLNLKKSSKNTQNKNIYIPLCIY